MTALRTEADLLRTLRGTYTMQEYYRLAEEAGLADRPGGRDLIQDRMPRWQRRMRSALQDARRRGYARHVGPATWLIEGTRDRPRRALFVWLPDDPTEAELVLGKAHEVLAQADEPIDLIVADPPWALNRGGPHSAYGRDASKVMPGYVEVDRAQYEDFTAEWLTIAAKVVRPGGYIAIITGPDLSGRVQRVGEDFAGLTYVNKIPVPRTWGLYTTRRFAHTHTDITLMTRGPLDSKLRMFTPPPEMPRGPKGQVFARDIWTDIVADDRRPGLLRYDNALNPVMVSRLMRSTTRRGDLVSDPFNGSGTTLHVCLINGRRFYGGDENPHSLRFAIGRTLAETVPDMQPGQLALLDPEGGTLL